MLAQFCSAASASRSWYCARRLTERWRGRVTKTDRDWMNDDVRDCVTRHIRCVEQRRGCNRLIGQPQQFKVICNLSFFFGGIMAPTAESPPPAVHLLQPVNSYQHERSGDGLFSSFSGNVVKITAMFDDANFSQPTNMRHAFTSTVTLTTVQWFNNCRWCWVVVNSSTC